MNIGSNIRKLTSFFILLFLALSGAMVYWQVAEAQAVKSNIHNGRSCQPENAPIRGRIYDRNGVLLAESVPDKNATCGYTRHYTEPSLAGLIGYYVPNYPSTGIEKQFDSTLNGTGGLSTLDNAVNGLLHRPPIGNDIYLTIDVRIQRIADQRFDDSAFVDNTVNFASDRGSIVVMNPQTGEVLAMVSRPGFDPNKVVETLQAGSQDYYNSLAADERNPLLERPLQGKYVPGSTYKTVTLMAGLDSGKTTLDQPFDEKHARGPVYFDGHPIGPVGNNIDGYTFHFPVTTEYGYAHSDNVIYAQIGVNTGNDTWMDYNKRLYVGQQIPFDLPTAVSTVLPPGKTDMTNLELAANAFGQGTDFVTPFQMSVVDNVSAADGQLMRPSLISKIVDHNKNTLQTFSPRSLSSPISAQTATQVRQAMYGVAHCGSGLGPNVTINQSPWGIIGKTGTAQLGGQANPHGWLITQAPYSVKTPDQKPALTIVAMKENAGEGGSAVGAIISNIYNDVFSKGYVQVQKPPVFDRAYCVQTGLIQY